MEQLGILIVRGREAHQWDAVEGFLSKRKSVSLTVARTTGEAMRALKVSEISIVLTDYDLPKVNAFTFLRRIKALKPYVEVIFLAGSTPLSHAIRAMKEGAYDFYEFPVNARFLMTVIEKAREKQALYFENKELEQRMRERFEFDNIVGRSKPMEHVLEIVGTVAAKSINVLVSGETGTGKELIASAIHFNSPRASGPFIKVNCAAFNEGVLESELFGHERGAFTGAFSQRIGRFELAHGGTIFLDEVGDITPGTQIRLLRVLQERQFERVGGNATINVDVRVISATNRDLKTLIAQGAFREDLYYRLNVVHISLPALRERRDDIPLLVSHFISRLNESKGYGIKGISKEAMRLLLDYSWPGNIRELENVIESAMALTRGPMVEAKYLPSFMLLAPTESTDHYSIPKGLTLAEVEAELIRQGLRETGGNRTHAAKRLGMSLRTLQRKLHELGLA